MWGTRTYAGQAPSFARMVSGGFAAAGPTLSEAASLEASPLASPLGGPTLHTAPAPSPRNSLSPGGSPSFNGVHVGSPPLGRSWASPGAGTATTHAPGTPSALGASPSLSLPTAALGACSSAASTSLFCSGGSGGNGGSGKGHVLGFATGSEASAAAAASEAEPTEVDCAPPSLADGWFGARTDGGPAGSTSKLAKGRKNKGVTLISNSGGRNG